MLSVGKGLWWCHVASVVFQCSSHKHMLYQITFSLKYDILLGYKYVCIICLQGLD